MIELIKEILSFLGSMALPVMEFQDQEYKIREIFAQKSTYPKEIIEFWELDYWGASVACKNQSF